MTSVPSNTSFSLPVEDTPPVRKKYERIISTKVKWNHKQHKLLLQRINSVIDFVNSKQFQDLDELISLFNSYQQNLAQQIYCKTLLNDGCVDKGFELLNEKLRHIWGPVTTPEVMMMEKLKEAKANDLDRLNNSVESIKEAFLGTDYPQLLGNHMQASIKRRLNEMRGLSEPYTGVRLYNITDLKYISGGGFAEVYSGVYEGNPVAVKLLKMQTSQEFAKEAQIFDKLRSKYVVRILGVCDLPENLFIVMELCQGTLYDLLHKCTMLPLIERLSMALEIAEGLQFLHNNKVLHCDLTSRNILLDLSNHCKIADFGLSLAKHEYSTLTAVLSSSKGTPVYMAPEVWDPKSYSRASDIYAFGVILWELITECALPAEEAIFRSCIDRRSAIPPTCAVSEVIRELFL